MIYILDDSLVPDHIEWCLVVESDKTVREMMEIISTLMFLCEECTGLPPGIGNCCLLELLTVYYGMKDIKMDHSGWERYVCTGDMPLPSGMVCKKAHKGAGEPAVIIDLREIEEFLWPRRLLRGKLYGKYLPAEDQIDEMKKVLLGPLSLEYAE